MLLATGVKDALRMGYLLLFIRKVPAWQQGPSPPASPPACYLSLLSSEPLEEVEGSFLGLRPCRREQPVMVPRLIPETFMKNRLSGQLCLRIGLWGQSDVGWRPGPPVVRGVTLGTSLPHPECAPLCALGSQAPQGSGQLERTRVCKGPSIQQALWLGSYTGPDPIGSEGLQTHWWGRQPPLKTCFNRTLSVITSHADLRKELSVQCQGRRRWAGRGLSVPAGCSLCPGPVLPCSGP